MNTTTAPLKWTTAQKLLAVLRDENLPETRLLLALGFYTGLRITDLLRLRWCDLTDDTLELTETKTGKRRTIDLHPRLRTLVGECSRQIGQPLATDFLFVGKRGPAGTRPLTVAGANLRIRAVFERFDVSAQHPSSHTLRKTFALRVYEAHHRSEDALILLSEMLNHSSIAVTRRYIGITRERIRNAYLSL